MSRLLLHRRQSARNYLLTARLGDLVAYLLPDGERHCLSWLEFIEHAEVREFKGARPVRLTDITRIGEWDDWFAPQWREVPPGCYIHGFLADKGAYAVYDTAAAVVDRPKRGRSQDLAR